MTLSQDLQKLVDLNLSGTDILHGELKNMMYEADLRLSPLQDNSDELGSDEEYEDTMDRLTIGGYMDALVAVNRLVIDLTYALAERTKSRERYV